MFLQGTKLSLSCSRGLLLAQKKEGTEEAELSGSCEVTLPSAEPFSRLEVPLRVEAELGKQSGAAATTGTTSIANQKNLGIVEHKVSDVLQSLKMWWKVW